MKHNKNAAIYNSLQGLIIFAIILIAILITTRGCLTSQKRLQDNSLKDIKEAIERVQLAQPGTTELVQVYMPEESMMLMYAPGHDAIITNVTKFNKYTMTTEPNGVTYYNPQSECKLLVDENCFDLQHRFQGYFKERAKSCPIDSFCVCECWPFKLETKTGEGQIYDSLNAHITCEQEKCAIIQEIKGNFDNISIKDFFKYLETQDLNKHHPKLDKVRWEGGIMVLRTKQHELGFINRLCKYGIQVRPPSTTQLNTVLTHKFVSNPADCPDEMIGSIQPDYVFDSVKMIAGNIRSVPSDFFDLAITKTNQGITFEMS